MKNSTKAMLITAVVLIALGLIGAITVMGVADWDVNYFGKSQYKTETVSIYEKFDSILINANSEDIKIAASEDMKCSVVFVQNKSFETSAEVKDGTLIISSADTRKWYEHINFFWNKNQKIEVYLPNTEYSGLTVNAGTSDIKTDSKLKFENVNITASTGDVNLSSSVTKKLDIKLSTGDIGIKNSSLGEARLTVTTGDVMLNNIKCRSLTSFGSTGDIDLKNVVATEKFYLKRSTGDIYFAGCDAAEIEAKTSTGDITGSLLSEKIFFTKTSTGDVKVPESMSGAKCDVETSTGDIILKIKR